MYQTKWLFSLINYTSFNIYVYCELCLLLCQHQLVKTTSYIVLPHFSMPTALAFYVQVLTRGESVHRLFSGWGS
jgi:hypothetical protein